MKKIVFALIMLAAVGQVCGQSYDTIYNRSDELYYSEWYDTALYFWDSGGPCCLRPFNPEGNTTPYTAISDYTEHPLRVRGLAVMHTINYIFWCMDHTNIVCSSPTRVPEYVRLYQSAGDTLIRLAHVQWDTATPQVLKLPMKQDTSLYGFEYVYLYRVYFDTPVVVDSVFYIAGSNYNNIYINSLIPEHIPTYNVLIGRPWSYYDPYVSAPRYHDKILYFLDDEKDDQIYRANIYNFYYGPFFPIITDTNVLMILHSADSTMGSVLGGGWYMDSTYATITALPERGFRFTHWDDGDTTNPRTVLMTQQMEFTAYFEEWTHILTVNADSERGSVTGGGTYRNGDTATIAARAWNIWKFVGWDDGDTTNPREVVVTQDTSFTALFLSTEGIATPSTGGSGFTLTPNPAQENCLLEMEMDLATYEGCHVTVADAQGREVLHYHVVSQTTVLATYRLASGVYMVTLTTPKGTASQRLVVNKGK